MVMRLVILALVVKMLAAKGNDCGVIPIIQWAGQESQRTETLPRPVDLVVIQHTVYTPCASDENCVKILRDIRAFQMKEGFTDIGQSFLVGGNGRVYEGAGWRVGAHTLGYNNRSVSVSFVGDFRGTSPLRAFACNEHLASNIEMYVGFVMLVSTYPPLEYSMPMLSVGRSFREALPTPAALQATKQFLSCAADDQLLTMEYRLVGHQQLSKTQSPGAALQKEIQNWPHWQENIKDLK